MAARLRFKKIDVKSLLLGGTSIPASVATEMAALDGLTSSAAELNILDGATLTVAELNGLDASVIAVSKFQKFAISAAPDGSEQDTTIILPAKAIVKRVILDITAAEATGGTKTIDIGTKDVSNDPNGYLAGVSCAATGLFEGLLDSGAQTLGALLVIDEDGAGALVRRDDLASFGATITFTAGDTDWVEFRGTIYVEYVELP